VPWTAVDFLLEQATPRRRALPAPRKGPVSSGYATSCAHRRSRSVETGSAVGYAMGTHLNRRGIGMGGRSIFYVIGVIVVILVVLRVLGLY
jgi:hypothetical protein